ncbi:MAG: peptide-methionine (S)-S-oxide reductase MsrA [Prevotellaceae bacterium]|jgi:peptide methionine sulfoxide reductase msrA/msrB|nr:peptide-methionine (S)-S-oxide reductase MsrA [Prevotellaceae bacterium]
MKKSEIYLAGGCFWGVEHFMSLIKGVVSTEVGYANGKTKNPTYEEVCKSNTEHAETVHVTYDADTISLEKILSLFFKIIDPTSLNKQGNDAGVQYRTGIYFTDSNDLPVIEKMIMELSIDYDKPIVIEVFGLKNFYTAEDYHQKYLEKNPAGYCHINPALFELAKDTKS